MKKWIAWIIAMVRAKRLHRAYYFSKREIFMNELRPFVPDRPGSRFAWPDAIFLIKNFDVNRAYEKAGPVDGHPRERKRRPF